MDEMDLMVQRKQEERAAKKVLQQKAQVLAAKRCGKCELGSPQVEFSRHGRSKDGLQGWCKGCLAEASKQGGAPKHKVTAVELAKFMRMMKDVVERLPEVDKVAQA